MLIICIFILILKKHISPGYRPFQKSDVKQVTKLLNNYLSKFSMRPIFSEKDVEHYFIPVPNAMSSFVIEVFSIFSVLHFSIGS